MGQTVGFIGLGIMGKPMARNLIKAGYSLVVYDITPESVKEVEGDGAIAASSSADVARQVDVVITMLPDGPEVEDAVTGPDGILNGARSGSVVVDMSSIAPPVTLRLGKLLADKSIRFVDAPVSGGEPRAIDGTLAIMVGGAPETVEEITPLLQAMGSSVVRVGGLGAGQVAKLVNQVLVAIHIHAMGEAFILASKAGVDPGAVFEAIKGGLAGSNVLNAKMPLVLERNFRPGFRMKLHEKDLRNALSTAEELGLSLPVTSMVQEFLSGLVADGHGDEDHGGLVQAIEGTNNVSIEPSADQIEQCIEVLYE